MIMARRFAETELVIASHNPGKIREIGDLLRTFDVTVMSAGDLELAEPEETETTFIGNAVLKAKASALGANKPALADDSGLAVTALQGAPGIYSARWAGAEKDFSVAMARVQSELGDTQDRSAHFICALALAWPDGHVETFEGRVDGSLTFPPRGEKGFGYDTIFIPDGFDITFAEMEPEKKHAMSHRADAFRQLVTNCFR